jgi:membrane protein implicated in regulation of membrane protease activity
MRRIEAVAIAVAVFLGGGLIYLVLQVTGLDGISAGIWTQLLLVVGLLVWASTYLFRVMTKNMTYNQQLEDYKEAVLQKRLEAMSPEELAKLQAEIEQE